MTSSSRCSHSDSIDGVVHDAVAEPESVEAVRSAVAQAAAEGSTVAPVGGRTRLDVGNPPDSVDLMLSSRRLEQLVRHTPDDLTAAAEAGITIERLQNELAGHGQYLAVDPPLPERATLGGTLAVGFSGPAKWQYSNVRDCVIGLSVVQADGNLTKSGGQVVKNVSGYDLARMHVGALGTLGMIVEASLKLTPLPRTEWHAAGGLPLFCGVLACSARRVQKPRGTTRPDRLRCTRRSSAGPAGWLARRLSRRSSWGTQADGGTTCPRVSRRDEQVE